MSYRPQYSYPPAPPGFRDETFHYSFDSTNTPLLGKTVAAGGTVNNIMLQLESDAPFICRAIKIQIQTVRSNFSVQLKTPHGDYLETVPVPAARAYNGTGFEIVGKVPEPIGEIECPAGSTWTLYLYNPTSGVLTPPAITLYGVKRRPIRRAA